MSEVENRAPASAAPVTKGGMKETATKPKITSDRKKLQTLQPNAKNQTLLVGSDGQLRMSGSGKKEGVKIFQDPAPAATSTPEKPLSVSKLSLAEAAVQAVADTSEGSSQVETEDTAQARAEAQMYGEEPGLDYWKELAEKRREALETSLLENEELHTSLSMEKEEKGLVERERDNLREMAEQAEELAKIVKSLVTEESEGEGDTTNEEADSTNDEADATNEEA